MLEYGYYWVKYKSNGTLCILEFCNEYDGVWMACGWDAPENENDFEVVCKIEPPKK